MSNPMEQKPVAFELIVDGAFHGIFRHELDAKESGFDSGKRFDLIPLYRYPQTAPDVAAMQAPIPDRISAQLERTDWTPKDALEFYANGYHFDVVAGRTRIIDTGAVASNALKSLSLEYLLLKGDAHTAEQAARIAELERVQGVLMGALEGLLRDVQGLMVDSEGVTGLHLNGDVAPWSELEEGGRFERLSHTTAAVEALAQVQEQSKCATCNGHGMVGGFINAENGYDAEPCPDCAAMNPATHAPCGACADGCKERGSCRLADESPEFPAQQPEGATMGNPNQLLADLVQALDATYWSSWQSTAGFSEQLDAARTYVESLPAADQKGDE